MGQVITVGGHKPSIHHVPPKSLAVGVPAKVVEGRSVPDMPRPNVASYQHYAEQYREAGER
ncbi:MAG TPA: hypothetical protein VGA69_09015 [Nitriliruptorales bacterium]